MQTMQTTPQENADELVEAFDMFDSWEDRYRFLIDLGRKLAPLTPDEKSEQNRIKGCQSNVWIVSQIEAEDAQKRLFFRADSDSTIVRGLIALLHNVYDAQTPRAVIDFDIDGFVQRVGLDQHLSIGRRNGMAGMIARLKNEAAHNL